MYGVTGENRLICVESDAFLYILGDPMLAHTLQFSLEKSCCPTSFINPIKIAGVDRECITFLKDVG